MIKLKILDKELTIEEAKKLYEELLDLFGKRKFEFEKLDSLEKLTPFSQGSEIVSYGPLPILDGPGYFNSAGNEWY